MLHNTLLNRAWLMVVIPAVLGTPPQVSASAPEEHDTTWNRPLPIGVDWALERGIDLPNPFGLGLFLDIINLDIEVYDVLVTLPGNEATSISNVASFDVRNEFLA